MKYLIERQDIIKELESWLKVEGYSEGELNIIKAVLYELQSLPSAQPEPHWIPCSERLPFAECGESDNVLATCGYRGVEDTSIRWIRTLYFDGDCWCCPTGGTYDQKVYAWMPLPEPWRGDSICK